MLVIKLILSAIWLLYCIYGIGNNYTHYSILDWILVLIFALSPILIVSYNLTVDDESKKIKFTLRKTINAFFMFQLLGLIIIMIMSFAQKEYEFIPVLFITTIICIIFGLLVDKLISIKMTKSKSTTTKSPQILKGNMKHMKGLPIAKGVSCEVTLIDNSYKFVANNAEFTLDKSKVLDLTLKTDVKVRRGYKTSVGGAAIGSMIGGFRGATLLGVKPKENRSYTYSLMITYNKNNKVSYIVLEEGAFSFFSNQLIKEFRKNAMPNNSIASFDL